MESRLPVSLTNTSSLINTKIIASVADNSVIGLICFHIVGTPCCQKQNIDDKRLGLEEDRYQNVKRNQMCENTNINISAQTADLRHPTNGKWGTMPFVALYLSLHTLEFLQLALRILFI